MKALDTPVLLAILHDSPGAKELLKSLHGEEIATTELNLFELGVIAANARATTRASREDALARLRRRVTVLPVTSQSVAVAAKHAPTGARSGGWTRLILGVLVAAGCAEWITTKAYAPARGKLPIRVRTFGTQYSK